MKTEKSDSVKTVLVISVGFGVVFFITGFNWAFNISLVVGILGIISNKICDLIHFLWMKLAKILSFIIPNILLSAVFYLLLFPIALLSKIFGSKNGLQLRNKKNSIWVERNGKIEKGSFEKMW